MYMKDFLGNKELIERLRRDAVASRTPHAIIFEGAKGSGKKTLAKYLALLLACEHSPNVCGECASCRKILSDNSPDVITVAPADGRVQIGVDTIRFIRSDVYVKPNDNNYKVYIIESADKMTHEAQNAFLKVLEEPPEYAVFIMLCESSDALLITVKSRSTVYSTERFTESTLHEYLINTSITAAELASVNPDAFKLAVMTANGSVGHALENIESTNAENAHKLYLSCLELIMLLRKRASAFDILTHLNAQEQSKAEFDEFLLMLESALYDIMSYKLSGNTARTFFLSDSDLEYAAAALTNTFVLEALDLLEGYRFTLSANANLQTSLTALASELYTLRSKF